MNSQDIPLNKIQVQGSIGCLSSVGGGCNTVYLDGGLGDGGEWSCEIAMQDSNEPTVRAVVWCRAYDIEDKLNNIISSKLETVDGKDSHFRISLVAYVVDAINVRATAVAAIKIMGLNNEMK
jgi:hypothetical protein